MTRTVRPPPAPATPLPGSAGFDALLEERLRGLPTPLRIHEKWRHSRNTLLYRLLPADGGPAASWIAKAYCTKPAAQLAEEHRVLQVLQRRLVPGAGVRSLEPTALWEDLCVGVTREERGESLQGRLQEANASAAGPARRAEAQPLLEWAAAALFHFHQTFGIQVQDGVERSRLYLDFCPLNLLVGDGEMVLVDPPEFDQQGDVHADLGTFCFELSRIGLRPDRVLRWRHGRVATLKAAFLRAYFQRLGRAPTAQDLARVRRYERARARQVLGLYLPFWRYRSPARELARACWFLPVIVLYDLALLPRSYRGLAAGLPPTG